MYQLIHKKRVQESFPNVEIALRMYLHGAYDPQLERGVFILKDETDQEQTSDIGMQWSHMVLMSIESDILREINFEDLVTEFAKKSRKVSLH